MEPVFDIPAKYRAKGNKLRFVGYMLGLSLMKNHTESINPEMGTLEESYSINRNPSRLEQAKTIRKEGKEKQ